MTEPNTPDASYRSVLPVTAEQVGITDFVELADGWTDGEVVGIETGPDGKLTFRLTSTEPAPDREPPFASKVIGPYAPGDPVTVSTHRVL